LAPHSDTLVARKGIGMARSSQEDLTTVGGMAFLAAFGSAVVAIIFGCMWVVRLNSGGSGSTDAPNIVAAGAACGFAITSGLCLVAAAIAESGAKRREPPPTRTSDSPPTGGPG
jgi:hypothetical protein